VIARVLAPVVAWRLALITSSMSAIPGALIAPRWGALLPLIAGERTPELSSEHRKNALIFPVSRSNHQRIVAASVAAAVKWRQVAAFFI